MSFANALAYSGLWDWPPKQHYLITEALSTGFPRAHWEGNGGHGHPLERRTQRAVIGWSRATVR